MWQDLAREVPGFVHRFDSRRVNDRLEVTVLEPFPGAATAGLKFPALYVLDPLGTFDIVAGTKRLFDFFSGGVLPLCYIVDVGYATMDVAARRFRDFTPTAAALPAGVNAPIDRGLGGAARYLAALRDEIFPELEKRYPLDPTGRIVLGYSLAGRFAAYVLFAAPQTFSRYLIIAPSLWWDDASVFEDEERWSLANRDLAAKILFIGGTDEESPGGDWRNNLPDEAALPLKQVSHLKELVRRVSRRGYPNLAVELQFVPEGRHISLFPAAVGLGLVGIFNL